MALASHPSAADRGIDHVAVLVNDLDTAQARFEAMGFTLTPRAFHPWGTANHLVQFQRSFIEIVGINDPTRLVPHTKTAFSFSAHARNYLAEREGMAMIVFSSPDAEADSAAWQAAGLRTYDPVYFERSATLPGGKQVKVAFKVCFTSHEALPSCAFFVCQHYFPEHFWKPQFQCHANGAANVGAATLCVSADPGTYRGFAQALTGRPSHSIEGGLRVNLACGSLDILGADAGRLAFPAVTASKQRAPTDQFTNLGIAVADLGAVASTLEAANIAFTRTDACLDVAPDEAFGVGLRFAVE